MEPPLQGFAMADTSVLGEPSMWSRRAALAGLMSVAATPASAAVLRGGDRFEAALRYARDRGGAGLLIQRHGVILAEITGEEITATALRPMGETTRILAPLLAAAMVQDNLVELDELVASSIEGWASDPRKTSVTIRMLLNQTSGVGMGVRGQDISHAVDAARAELAADPSTLFLDDPAPLHVFAEIAQRKIVAAGRDADLSAYLSRRLFDPLRASILLSQDQGGIPILSTGGRGSLADWAKLAELIRRGGIQRGRALVSATVLRDAQIGSFLQPRFGLGLWLAARPRAAGEDGLDLADRNSLVPPDSFGLGGQDGCRIYVVPAASVVVARAANRRVDQNTWSDAALLTAILAQI